MAQNLFHELHFDVTKEVFYEVLENRDGGFGFKALLKSKHLDELQIDTLDFLVNCYNKKLLGLITLYFVTSAVGEIKPLQRNVEKIVKYEDGFMISNSY